MRNWGLWVSFLLCVDPSLRSVMPCREFVFSILLWELEGVYLSLREYIYNLRLLFLISGSNSWLVGAIHDP